MSRRLRLSGGRLGGRVISAPDGIRPTSARVREALLDIWAPRLSGARFLDLFAGSGAVGLEAAGRGAATVCLVDNERQVLATLRANVERLGVETATVLALDLSAQLRMLESRLREGFDLIFADPPYDFAGMPELLEDIAGLLARGGEAALEHAAEIEVPEVAGALNRFDCRRYGDSAVSFYRTRLPATG